ncbi:MAG: hypothetical protein ABGX08_17440 [Citromicrobium sp.]
MDQQRFRMDQQAAALKQQEQADKQAKLQQAQSDSVSKLARVIQKIDTVALDAADNGGWFETGATGAMLRGVPGTAAKDLASNIQTIDANSAFATLQAMRDASPTGGALGQVTERELDLLKSTIANLDPNQSQEQFLANLATAKQAYLEMLRKIDPAEADKLASGPGIQVNDRGETVITTQQSDNRQPINPFGVGDKPQGGGGGGGGGDGSGGGNPFQNDTFGSFGETMNVLGTLGKQGITFGLSDEAAGIGGAIGAALTGGNIREGYNQYRDEERAKIAAARERLGPGGVALELAGAGGGARAVVGGVGQTLRAGRQVVASGNALTRGAVQSQLRRSATMEGAGLGALGGAGYGEGVEGRATNALIGGAGGALVGNLGQRIGGAMANRANGPDGRAVQQAADRIGVEPTPALTGGRTTQMATAGARQGFISDAPISRRVATMEGQARAARDKAADAAGTVADFEDAGNLVRRGAQVYSSRTSQIGSRLYERADRMAAGQKFPLPKAIEAADAEIAQLAKAPGGQDSTLYQEMSKLRDQMAAGSFEVDGIRAFRTRLRNEISERGLRGSPQDVAYQRVLKAAEEDMLTGLREAGMDNAANALKTATDFWRKRVTTIDEVLEPVLGKSTMRSGEQILTALENMAKPKSGNAARLRQLFDAMPKEEAASVRATLINRLGRPNPGNADMAEEAGFSFGNFLTNWNNISPRAKSVFFPKETRAALDDLATVSQAAKRAGSAMNSSNTAGSLAVQAVISTPQVWFLDPLSTIGLTGGQYMVGRLLASPRFARLLARAPKVGSPQARAAFDQRLAALAKSEPALANEIGIYRNALAANDNAVGSLAADEGQTQK